MPRWPPNRVGKMRAGRQSGEGRNRVELAVFAAVDQKLAGEKDFHTGSPVLVCREGAVDGGRAVEPCL